MGSYTSVLVQGIVHEKDLKKINNFLDKARESGYSPLVNVMCKELPTFYFGEYNHFPLNKFVKFLEEMDWEDCMPDEHIALFVMLDEDFKYQQWSLNIPDQNWKNFGKNGD